MPSTKSGSGSNSVFVELIELLRCPRQHPESQLVVAATHSVDRHIVDGMLGCPVCNAEFPIRNGVAQFDAVDSTPAVPPDPELAIRLAAFLDLTDARGFALLAGAWCAQLDALQRICETPIVLINPPPNTGGIPAGVIQCNSAPFATGALRAATVAGESLLRDSIVRAVRAGGRILATSAIPVPVDVTELDRDDAMWVAEKGGGAVIYNIQRSK